MTLSDNQAVMALLRMKEHIDRIERARGEAIAIVGLAARTPFESQGLSLWEGLSRGVDTSREIPPDRWDADAFYDPDVSAPGKAICKRASFLSDVANFDARFFEIAPIEAQMMDPQQRLALEVGWEALADAGLSLGYLRQVRTGVFVGVCEQDYGLLTDEIVPEAHAPYLSMGKALSFTAGRLSYAFGLTGPALVIDTACSSSLAAAHLACESLRLKTSDVALVGGVNLLLSPLPHVYASKFKGMSADGRCRTFDASGTGFGRGEGCGFIVLKRVSDAVRDGDRILALIRGSALNQDGKSDGMSAPNGAAQEDVFRSTLAFAKLGPGDVQYVEAHGTGTVLGDPIEVESINEVYGPAHAATVPLAIGSIKSNIGHLEGAAGVVGLMKTVLSIHHRQLPPSLHFQTPNPHIPWSELPLRVQTKLGPWPQPDKELIAAVSSFGMSGTNAHAVVSEPPKEAADAWKDADRLAREAKLLPLFVSAKTPEALRAYAKRLAEHVKSPLEGAATWRDLSYTSAARRTHFEHRLAVVGGSAAEWSEKLEAFSNGETRRGLSAGAADDRPRNVVFVFPGHGSQWLGMGKSLLESSTIFREHVERCEAAFRPFVKWSLWDQLSGDADKARLGDVDVVQPTIFVIQTGLAAIWASWGVVPDAVVGHSMGEAAAAFVSGALTLEDAARVICVRSNLLARVRGRGAMAVLDMTMAEAEAEIASYGGKISVAACNGPHSTAVAGDAAEIAALVESLQKREVFCRPVNGDVAFHTHHVDELKSDLLRELASLRPKPPTVAVVSTALADSKAKPTFDASYWWSNMRDPVRLSQRVAELIDGGYELFVEMSPRPVLTVGIEESLRAAGKTTKVIAASRRDQAEAEVMLEALGTLHVAGYAVNWEKFFGARGRVVSFPSYPWQRERYWLPVSKSAGRRSESNWSFVHRHYASSDQPGKYVFELELDLSDGAHGYLADHKVQGNATLPAAAYLEMALQAARIAFDGKPTSIDGLAMSAPIILRDGEPVLVQLVAAPEQGGTSEFRIAARSLKDRTAQWVEHATGRIVVGAGEPLAERSTLSELQQRCTREVDVNAIYDDLESTGLSLGPAFQGLNRAWCADGEALSELAPLEKLVEGARGDLIHPALLDAAFHTLSALKHEAFEPGRTYVASGVGSVVVVGSGAPRWVHLKRRPTTSDTVEADLRLLDDKGALVAEVRALRATATGRASDKLDHWTYELAWRVSQASVADTSHSLSGRWLLLADEQGVAIGLKSALEARGCEVTIATRANDFAAKGPRQFHVQPLDLASMQRLFKEAFGTSAPTHIVHFWSLDTRKAANEPLDEAIAQRAQDLTSTSTLHVVQALEAMAWTESPRLFMVTRSCQAARGSSDVRFPEQALAWGFNATLAHEMPKLHPTSIDLDEATSADALADELGRADEETRVALRAGERLTPRLVRFSRETKPTGAVRSLSVGSESYRFDIKQPGETSTLEPAVIPTPAAGQVVIRTRASGITFRDVLATEPGGARGRGPIGAEYAGVIYAIGEGVAGLHVDDEVVGLGTASTGQSGLDAFVVNDARLVIKKPANLDFAQAASLPIAAMTALYALERVARLRKGERVLIHAATGGVGLAAIQYAKHVGAEIYATAGSEEKRAHLRTLGIEHVYDSRTLTWFDDVKRDTRGIGVDVVLNSLTGEAVVKGVSALSAFGRFIELRKRDLYTDASLGHLAARANVTLAAIALDELILDRPEEAQRLLTDAIRLVDEGVFAPLPVTSFPISRVADAFGHLARAQHLGKVVITAEPTVHVRDPRLSEHIHSDKTYLVTGLGGRGLVAAKRLVGLGAKHVALLGRSAPSEGATKLVHELEQMGAKVHIVRADIANRQALGDALATLARSAPPVAGVVHAAGVLDDAPLSNLTPARIGAVLAPKVLGALALETLLPDLELRVYWGSDVGVLGSAGQAPYAAASTFLDAFAHYVSSRSGRALSLDWGIWGDVGLGAGNARSENAARQGLAMLTSEEGAELFERALFAPAAQVIPLPTDFQQWRQANPQVASARFLSEAIASSANRSAQRNVGLLQRVAAATSDAARVSILADYLVVAVATILGASPSAVSRSKPFKHLGFDSMMTVGLKNTVERDCAIPMNVAMLFQHPSVERLAAYLATKIDGGTRAETPVTPAPVEEEVAPVVTKLNADTATEEELRKRLAERLSQLQSDDDD